MEEPIIDVAIKELGVQLYPEKNSYQKQELVKAINDLLEHDFDKLVRLLYRLDINEHKLKHLLREHQQTDAAVIITDLIIERQVQKIKSRREQSQRDNPIDDNEKW